MVVHHDKDVTSLEALKDTIMQDAYTYRWFTHLIVQPDLRKKGSEKGSLNNLYRSLRNIMLIQGLSCMAMLGTMSFYILSGAVGELVVGTLCLLAYGKALHDKRKCVAAITLGILPLDFDGQTLKHKTLFQITEYYAQHYKIPSLVDVIYHLDRFYRATIIVLIISILLVYPVRLEFGSVLLAVCAYFAVINIANIGYFYKMLK